MGSDRRSRGDGESPRAVPRLSREDLAALEAAGLYDPAAANGGDRVALLEWIVGHGFTTAQIIDGMTRPGSTLTGLVSDLARAPQTRLTLAEIPALAGIDPARIERLCLAAGFPPFDARTSRFSLAEADALAAFAGAMDRFGEPAILSMLRVVGSSLARVAEAAVSTFMVNIEGPLRDANAGDVALAEANLAAIGSLDVISGAMQSLFSTHMTTAIRRMRAAREARSVDLVRMAVGFIDLVGFTSLSRKLSARELAGLVEEFEGRANDIVAARDARLVKVIGDEVMFVAHDVSTACDVALTLIERFAADRAVTPRGGLASGPLLTRGGDYYGPTVNLASRIADVAVPSEVLVSSDVAAQAARERFRFEPSGKRMLKGFDDPIVLFAAERA